MIGPFGETLVMDWGVAKLIGQSDDTDIVHVEPTSDSGESAIRPQLVRAAVTLNGQAVGTPTYMSPEQAAGKLDALGPASDVYSLGATLYVVLTGQAAVLWRGEGGPPHGSGGPGRTSAANQTTGTQGVGRDLPAGHGA